MCPDGGSEPSVELSTVRKEEGGCGGIIRDIDVLMVVVVVKVVTFVVVEVAKVIRLDSKSLVL